MSKKIYGKKCSNWSWPAQTTYGIETFISDNGYYVIRQRDYKNKPQVVVLTESQMVSLILHLEEFLPEVQKQMLICKRVGSTEACNKPDNSIEIPMPF